MGVLGFASKLVSWGKSLVPKMIQKAAKLAPGLVLSGAAEALLKEGDVRVQSLGEVVERLKSADFGEYDSESLAMLLQALSNEMPYHIMLPTLDNINPATVMRCAAKAMTSETMADDQVDKLASVLSAACISAGQAGAAASIENLAASLLFVADAVAGKSAERTAESIATDTPAAVRAILSLTGNSSSLDNENFVVVATTILSALGSLMEGISENGGN